MKLLSRRYQPLPGWFYCRDCPQRGHGAELDARQHTVITGHETRHITGAQIIFRIPRMKNARPRSNGDGRSSASPS